MNSTHDNFGTRSEKFPRWAMLISTVVVLLVVSVISARVVLRASEPAWDTTVTELDFESQKGRKEFVAQFLPVALPDSCTVVEIKFVSWLDWNLFASVSMDKKTAAVFFDEVKALRLSNGDGKSIQQAQPRFEGQFNVPNESGVTGKLEYDPLAELVTIDCSG